MANFVIATPKISDAATLTGSACVDRLPLSNVQTQIPFDRARFLSTSPFMVFDLGAAVDINLIWAGFLNLTSSATWRIRLASTEAGLTAAPGYDSTAVTAWPAATVDTEQYPRVHATAFYAAAKTYRWVRIDFADAGNPAGYIDVGRVIIDAAFVPSENMQDGFSIVYIDPSEITRPAAGGGITRRVEGYREAAIPFAYRSRADVVGNLAKLDRTRGRARSILFIGDTDDTTYLMDVTVYGVVEPSPVGRHFDDQYIKPFAVSELEHP